MDNFEIYADSQCEVGEGVIWHPGEQTIYWIDVSRGDVYRKLPGDLHSFERYQLNLGKIGGMILLDSGKFLLFAAAGKVWKWCHDSSPELITQLPQAENSRFNDVIADPEGRVFCGVMPPVPGATGSLWRMDADLSFHCIEPVTAGVPNGMGFSPDLRFFYFTVTGERRIYRYDYHRASGKVSNRQTIVAVPENEGFPDGMTVDAEGCLWSAQWNGHRLVRYSPAGEKLAEFTFAAAKVSCAAFGGKNLDELYVTTANHPWNESDYLKDKAGALFRMRCPSVKGRPEFTRPDSVNHASEAMRISKDIHHCN